MCIRDSTINNPHKRLFYTEQYHETATANQDSFFLAHSTRQLAILHGVLSDTFTYHIHKGNLISNRPIEQVYINENPLYLFKFIERKEAIIHYENHRIIQNQYGIHTSELPLEKVVDLHSALTIFEDNTGNADFDQILTKQKEFTINNTFIDFDPSATYWIKLTLRGGPSTLDTCSFFVENMKGFSSWKDIQAYLVHEDGQIEQQQTGIDYSIEEKPLPLLNNIVRFGIAPQEKASLYIRLKGVTEKRTPRSISLLGTRNTHLSFSDVYQTDGTFNYATFISPFKGNKFTNRKIFICLLYTSPSPRDATLSRMPSSA